MSTSQNNNNDKKNVCNIKVALRVRPLIRSEIFSGHKCSKLLVNDEDN